MTDALHMYKMNNMINICLPSLLTDLFEAYPIPLTPRCRVIGIEVSFGRASNKSNYRIPYV